MTSSASRDAATHAELAKSASKESPNEFFAQFEPSDAPDPSKAKAARDLIKESIQSGSNWTPVEAKVKLSSGGRWKRIFYNTQPNTNPNRIVFTQLVKEGTRIDFGGRYYLRRWGSFHNTDQQSSLNMVPLKDGDSPPSYAPAYSQGNIEAFLDPYIDSNGNIDIGPQDVIYLFELYSTRPSSPYFDMQDLVILVTFRNVVS